MGEIVGIGVCYGCREGFSFDPDTVAVILIDPRTWLPPDMCTCQDAPRCVERAERIPVCPECMQRRAARQGQN